MPDTAADKESGFKRLFKAGVEYFTAQLAPHETGLQYWRERILLATYLGGLVLALPVAIPSVAFLLKTGRWQVALMDLVVYLAALVVALTRRLSYRFKAFFFLAFLLITGTGLLIMMGPMGSGRVWLFAFAVSAAVLLSLRAAMAALAINALVVLFMAWLMHTGHTQWAGQASGHVAFWLLAGASFLFVNGLITILLALLLRSMGEALGQERASASRLAEERAHLEQANLNLAREMAERLRAQEALHESEHRFRSIFQAAPDAIFLKDTQRRYLLVNQAWEEMFGFSNQEALGRTFEELRGSQEGEPVKEVDLRVLSGEMVTVERAMDNGPNTQYQQVFKVPMRDADGRIYGVCGMVRDVSEFKRLEEQLRQSQKMEAVGTLASGIAHDFNNILQVIRGYLQVIKGKENDQLTINRRLAEIDRAVERASDLVRRLLTFGRKVAPRLGPVDLNQQVRSAVKLLERTIPKMIRIVSELDEDLWPISGDPGQLDQILMNLAANARDAMPQGGQLFITTKNLDLQQDREGIRPPDLGPGRYILLQVADTGAGMEPQVLRHIFEPFYTTKGVGQGTGLGLSTAYGIIKSHGGTITCQSVQDSGTTFNIFLPVQEQADTHLNLELPLLKQELTGDETLLMADDESAVLETANEVFRQYGYQVLTAQNGKEALDIYRQKWRDINMVVLDLGMPGMGGQACLQHILELNPQARVLVASGYTDDGQVEKILRLGAAAFLAKPYRLVKLVMMVRQLLDQAP